MNVGKDTVEGKITLTELSDECKARILDGFLSLIILQTDSTGIIRYLRGEGYDFEVIFNPYGEGGDLRYFISELFDLLSEEEARSLFMKFLPVVLADELGAKKVSIEWD